VISARSLACWRAVPCLAHFAFAGDDGPSDSLSHSSSQRGADGDGGWDEDTQGRGMPARGRMVQLLPLPSPRAIASF
jgi:hypothetical protein